MMKNLLILAFAMLMTVSLFSQELNADDRLTITQSSKPFIGVYAFGYQGLPTPGYPQFQLNNYGGVPGTPAATADNSILGMFAFSGHNGSAKRTVGIVRVRSMDNFASSLASRMDFLIGPNREQRMTILGNSGYVGIATDTPTQELDVNGKIRMREGSSAGYIPVSNANGVMTWTDPSALSKWSETGADVYRSTGDVGIGGAPDAKLHIRTENTQIDDGIRMSSSLGNSQDWYYYMDGLDNLNFNDDGIDRMTIENGTGNVGVGIENPESKMHVVDSGGSNTSVVYGESEYTGNSHRYAVLGRSVNNPGYGYGGFFEGGYRGVYARADGTTFTGSASAVYGYGTGTAGSRRGVTGQAYNPGGNEAYGVYGTVTGSSTTNYGIYGTAVGGTTNWAGFFLNGNVYVENKLGINDETPSAYLDIETDGSTSRAIDARVNYVGTNDVRAINGISVSADGYGYGVTGTGGYRGVYGLSSGGGYSGSTMGVYGLATGSAGTRYSIYGANPTGTAATEYAGYFAGAVNVTGTFTNPSDRKLKQNIESYTDALEIIEQLETKTYDYKNETFEGMGLPDQSQIGFIAQEVEKVLPNLVTTNVHPEEIEYDEEGNRVIVREAIDYKGINYIGLIPVLTQGIKELTDEVEAKDETIEKLVVENAAMKSELATVNQKIDEMTALVNSMNDKFNQMEEDMSSCCFNGADSRTGSVHTNIELNGSDIATLEQNSPNPFNEQTVIKYYIPSFAQKATMTITDIKGSPLKSINLEETGLGTVTINANELPVGTYVYTLYVDGRQVESKQMVLIK